MKEFFELVHSSSDGKDANERRKVVSKITNWHCLPHWSSDVESDRSIDGGHGRTTTHEIVT